MYHVCICLHDRYITDVYIHSDLYMYACNGLYLLLSVIYIYVLRFNINVTIKKK